MTDDLTIDVLLSSNELEAANRAEATALLFRSGYRVYRPEADVDGEDLILQHKPSGELRRTQLKPRPYVDRSRYENKGCALNRTQSYNRLAFAPRRSFMLFL